MDPSSPAARTESEWAGAGRTAEAGEIAKIAGRPTAEWFGDWSYGHGSTEADVGWWVGLAGAAGALPVLVAYDIPWRDCAQYSSGGAPSAGAYEQFVNGMAQGIAGRPAVVILEPDALAELTCLSSERQATYYSLLSYAVKRLGASPATAVYLDAGNAGWQPAATMAARLRQAGVLERARVLAERVATSTPPPRRSPTEKRSRGSSAVAPTSSSTRAATAAARPRAEPGATRRAAGWARRRPARRATRRWTPTSG